ncbi:hypothetical protein [Shimia sp. Alg240-R146]|nr:hypothetical protein [Shimia sp. Alg240-R146]
MQSSPQHQTYDIPMTFEGIILAKRTASQRILPFRYFVAGPQNGRMKVL